MSSQIIRFYHGVYVNQYAYMVLVPLAWFKKTPRSYLSIIGHVNLEFKPYQDGLENVKII